MTQTLKSEEYFQFRVKGLSQISGQLSKVGKRLC